MKQLCGGTSKLKNHGDEGMDAFFRKVSRLADLVLLEPQPWKCYRTAARRMRKLGQPEFAHLRTLEAAIEGAGTKVEGYGNYSSY